MKNCFKVYFVAQDGEFLMIERLQKMQTHLNNLGSDRFAKEYYGKHFTGSMTLVDGQETGTLFFRNGVIYDYKEETLTLNPGWISA